MPAINKDRRFKPITHGKYSTYNNRKCHCDLCKAAWTAYQKQYYRDKNTKRPGGSVCEVCGESIATHPIRACWRLVG